MNTDRPIKLLLISYYWPPSGGSGVQRPVKFVKHLPSFGIDTTVYTVENGEFPTLDNSLLKDIPESVKVIKRKIFEPYAVFKLISGNKKQKISSNALAENSKKGLLGKLAVWVRSNFFIPDARMFWIKPSVKFLTKYINDNNITHVITTGPPHSLHVIGLNLKKKTDIKWIADFRDPWTEIEYFGELSLMNFALKKHQDLEKETLSLADQIVVTAPGTKQGFLKTLNKPEKYHVITNGFDKDDFEGIKPKKKNGYTICYTGYLRKNQNYEVFWKAIGSLIHEKQLDIHIEIIGKQDIGVLEIIKDLNLEKNVTIKGFIPHNEVLVEMLSADMLYMALYDVHNGGSIIPGKLFEYLASKKPILAIGEVNSDVNTILNQTNAGEVFSSNDIEGVTQFINDKYSNIDTNTLNEAVISRFERKELTSKLVSLIK